MQFKVQGESRIYCGCRLIARGNGRSPAQVREQFPLKPAEIIRELDLKHPIYQRTASYGHFGREPEDGFFTWERTDRVAECHGQRRELVSGVLDLTTELAELYRTVETVTTAIENRQADLQRLRSNRQVHLQNITQRRDRLLEQQKELSKLQLQAQHNPPAAMPFDLQA